MFGDDIWDEERWESFLRENDRRVNRYMDLLYRYLSDNPAPGEDDVAARAAWEDGLRTFLRARGLEPGDTDLPLLPGADAPGAAEAGYPPEEAPFGGDEGDVDDLVEAAPEDLFDDVHRVPVYGRAFALATDVLEWSNALPGAVKDSTFVQFCSHVTQIPANVAKGHGLGYERDTLGGNIACVKRGLAAANSALELLREMRGAPYMRPEDYRRLYEAAFELRNELGLYVQELRRRFDLGVD